MDLTTLSKINSNTGRTANLGAGNAKGGNQDFLSRTQNAQATLASQQAIISADQAIVDAKLSQKITEAYLTSPGYLKYQQSLADQQAKQAQLNTLIEDALINSPAMIALKAEEKQLATRRSVGENVLPTLGGIAGGLGTNLLANKLLPKAGAVAQGGGGLLGKGGGILGKAGGLLGKVAAPLMIAKGLYDGFQGFTADKDATTGQKFMNAGSSVLSGLTFGLLGKDSDTIAADAAKRKAGVTPAQVAAVTPGNTSVTTAAAASEKWMQNKLTYMSGNLERVVDRTTKTANSAAASLEQLKTLNTNTLAMKELTRRIEALTRATYEGGGKVVIDGKTLASSVSRYADNTQGTNPNSFTQIFRGETTTYG
jgi:hypothetical protein